MSNTNRPLWQVMAPIPITERLPGPDDCDAEGRCWWLGIETWILRSNAFIEGKAIPIGSHWLPTHVLPLPTNA